MFDQECTIAWVPVGDKPTDDDFKPTSIPTPSPEVWQKLREAVPFSKLNAPVGCVPWIKIGETTLSPEQVSAIFNAMYPGFLIAD